MFCYYYLFTSLDINILKFTVYIHLTVEMPPRRRRHGLELGLILLLNELLQFGMRNIPPVTLSSILGQVIHFFKFHYF